MQSVVWFIYVHIIISSKPNMKEQRLIFLERSGCYLAVLGVFIYYFLTHYLAICNLFKIINLRHKF